MEHRLDLPNDHQLEQIRQAVAESDYADDLAGRRRPIAAIRDNAELFRACTITLAAAQHEDALRAIISALWERLDTARAELEPLLLPSASPLDFPQAADAHRMLEWIRRHRGPGGARLAARQARKEGVLMAAAGITGHVRTLDRQGGKVFYAKLKIAKPDGTTFEPQRRLGKVWTRRTRPPEGHLTRRMADARLEAILAGDDPLVNVDVPSDVVTLGQACDEHLRYLEFDRQRKPSYVKDCRSMVHCYLLPAFGESLPVTAITTADVDRLRDRLLSTPRARRLENGSAPPIAHKTAQKVLVLLGGILGRGEAQGLDHDEPVRGRRKGQRQAIRRVQRAERRASPRRRACRRRRAARGADRRGGVHRLAPGRACSRCAGVTSTSATGSSTCGATWRRARRRRTRRRRTAFAACRFPIRRWWRSTG